MPSPFAFSSFDPNELMSEVEKRLGDYQASIDQIIQGKHTEDPFTSILLALEIANSEFSKFWQPIYHLNLVKKSDELTEAYAQANKQVTEFFTKLYQNEGLFKLVDRLKSSDAFAELDFEQRRLIDHYLLDFKLSGILLTPAQKQEFLTLETELSEAQDAFRNNTTASTGEWSKHILDEAELLGLPQQVKNQARKLAQDQGKDGWVITLEPSIVTAVKAHAQNRNLRKEVHHAMAKVASPLANPAFDNGPHMVKIIELRARKAKMLGFADYVDLSLAQKMATREQVETMQTELTKALKPHAQKELETLRDFARKNLGLAELKAYDVSFVSARYKEAQYNVDEKLISEYFPADKVLSGMFQVVNRLFGITLQEEKGFDSWHPDVRLFSVYDEQKQKRGEIYFDLFARNGEKRAGAWMDTCVPRLVTQAGIQNPIAFLNTNFGKGDGSQPSLLTFREVQTTFHEFGHCLHEVLSQARYPSIAGTNVERDAVESPSQMMENWIWDHACIQYFSEHFNTKETLPQAMMEAIGPTRNYNIGIMSLAQLSYSSFDFSVYSGGEHLTPEQIQDLWVKTFNETQVIPRCKCDYFPNDFNHIFSGGYAAGYYVYKWALNISYDLFSEFKKKGLLDETTGRRYLHQILEPGGSKPFMELVKGFLEREPNPRALAEAIVPASPSLHFQYKPGAGQASPAAQPEKKQLKQTLS